jgi:hypothetical protein
MSVGQNLLMAERIFDGTLLTGGRLPLPPLARCATAPEARLADALRHRAIPDSSSYAWAYLR